MSTVTNYSTAFLFILVKYWYRVLIAVKGLTAETQRSPVLMQATGMNSSI